MALRAVARFAEDPNAAVLGLLAMAVVLTAVLPKLHRSLPASLIAVVATTVAALVTGADVTVIGDLPRTLPSPTLPDLSSTMALLSPALAVAALVALESLLSARVADGMVDVERHSPNRELVGQGIANIASGLFAGMPATGALARTAVNARAGARTRLAALSHALVLAVMMAAAAGVVGRIPLVALAGVLLVTAYRMVERHAVKAVVRSTHTDAAVFTLTAAATVVFNLVVAVEIGIVVAVVTALVHLASTAKLVEDDTSVAKIASEEEHELLRQHVLVYRLDGPLFFGAASRFLAELTTISDVRVVVLRLGNLAMLDATGARALSEIIQQFDDRASRSYSRSPRRLTASCCELLAPWTASTGPAMSQAICRPPWGTPESMRCAGPEVRTTTERPRHSPTWLSLTWRTCPARHCRRHFARRTDPSQGVQA